MRAVGIGGAATARCGGSASSAASTQTVPHHRLQTVGALILGDSPPYIRSTANLCPSFVQLTHPRAETTCHVVVSRLQSSDVYNPHISRFLRRSVAAYKVNAGSTFCIIFYPVIFLRSCRFCGCEVFLCSYVLSY